jgi:hypothetical protein
MGAAHPDELRSHRYDRCRPLLGFARVNVWVSSLLSHVAAILSLGRFGDW